MLSIQINELYVEAGGVVHGSVQWWHETLMPNDITIQALWRTEGDGISSWGKAGEVCIRIEPSSPLAAPPVPFSLNIPAEGPISYEGINIRIIWEITAQAKIPQRVDEKQAEKFYVVVRQR